MRIGRQKDRVLYNTSVDTLEDKKKVFHNTYMEDLIHRKIKKCPNCCNEDLVQRKTEYFTTLTIDTEDLVTERQSTSQHLQGKFGTQKDRVLHNTYMDRKTKYSTTLTWKIWYTERQSTSQHLHGQKDEVLHNTYMEDLVHRKTKYFSTLTSYMEDLVHTKTHKDRVLHTTYKLHVLM